MARINSSTLANQTFAVTHNWDIEIAQHPNISNPPAGLFGDTGLLNINAESSDLPSSPVTYAETKVRGVRITQAVEQNVAGTLTMTLLCDDAYSIKKYTKQLKDLAVNRSTRNQGNKEDYQQTSGWKMKLKDGENASQQEFLLKYWSIEDAVLEGPNADGDFQRITITIHYLDYTDPV